MPAGEWITAAAEGTIYSPEYCEQRYTHEYRGINTIYFNFKNMCFEQRRHLWHHLCDSKDRWVMFKTVEEPTKLYHIQDQTDSRKYCPNMICNHWCVLNLCIYMHKHNIHDITYYIYNNYSTIPFCSQVGGKDNPAVDPIIHGLRGVVHHGEWQSCVKDHGGLNFFILRLCFVPKNVDPLFILTFMEATVNCFTICDST